MRGFPAVLAVLLTLTGCNTVTGKLEEPGLASASTPAKQANAGGDVIPVENCELKNPAGTGECDDGRHATQKSPAPAPSTSAPPPAASAPPPAAAAPKRVSANRDPAEKFNPGMCKSVAEGGTGVFAFYGSLLTGNLAALNTYCENLENGSGQDQSQASASGQQGALEAGDGSTEGTWFCEDSVDGSGNYGTFEMTQHPERFYDCKRVN